MMRYCVCLGVAWLAHSFEARAKAARWSTRSIWPRIESMISGGSRSSAIERDGHTCFPLPSTSPSRTSSIPSLQDPTIQTLALRRRQSSSQGSAKGLLTVIRQPVTTRSTQHKVSMWISRVPGYNTTMAIHHPHHASLPFFPIFSLPCWHNQSY